MNYIQNINSKALAFLFIMATGLLLLSSQTAEARRKIAPEKIKVIIIGDRLVDIAYNLGVVPEAMSVRCWSGLSEKLSTVQALGCPRRVIIKDKETVVKTAAEKGIKRIMIEKNKNFDIYLPPAA